ncbi:hypothetical protein SADUNF_Sadunf01G0113400 [Salix dunnii]|uniref:Uncharacterized protein n=1 Tax=Salix dunnii TaxID=1413687 RepID=A0A835TK66_9ROSI|nr:hypothetical protein SADUNF_Sadunf01G0113400 [Salix dunnii]
MRTAIPFKNTINIHMLGVDLVKLFRAVRMGLVKTIRRPSRATTKACKMDPAHQRSNFLVYRIDSDFSKATTLCFLPGPSRRKETSPYSFTQPIVPLFSHLV